MIEIPTVLWVAIVAALTSFLTSSRQVRVSRHTLFASLLPKRQQWLEDFSSAVVLRNVEINDSGPNPYMETKPKLIGEQLQILYQLTKDARWLFDQSVSNVAKEILSQLEDRAGIWLADRTTNGADMAAMRRLQEIGDALSKNRAKLSDACQPFLYVGDVKRSRRFGRWW